MLVILLIIIVIVFIFMRKGNSKKSSNQSSASPASKIPSFNPNDVYDLCYALGCMVGCAALADRDERPAALLVCVDSEKKTTSIYVSAPISINDTKNPSEYKRIGVPEIIANGLSEVPFVMKERGSLRIDFNNKTAGTVAVKESIEKGLDLLPYKPGECLLKSYVMSGEPAITCIDLFVARD